MASVGLDTSINIMIKLITGEHDRNFYNLIRKWKNEFTVRYLYYVVKRIYNSYLKKGKSFSIGAIVWGLVNYWNDYERMGKIVHIESRADLLASGYTVDMLPLHLLTEKEFQARRNERRPSVTNDEVDKFKEFMRNRLANRDS